MFRVNMFSTSTVIETDAIYKENFCYYVDTYTGDSRKFWQDILI